ncbi:hypothetical protein [Goodfellowiella coeruleoviolacea]|uniref:Uncharacterized protein n=1 Tax=Goodfellowiella coeruleoviolacea TaxID=334858 RepID=A0AAE3KEG6_9PSEU|nr:hypothetical protein [Goodfellowiella coeruleoviolacea]MCP2163882.1 hypothetical protein [Goodfellowiella coeruleoviolacea]
MPAGTGLGCREEELRDLRQRGHDAGVRGSSGTDERQPREALGRVAAGENPTKAKREAKGWE